MNDFVLGIDAGATKTKGLLKCVQTSELWSVVKGPGSITNDLSGACSNIKDVAQALLEQAGCSAEDTILACGAAGATNEAAKEALESTLKMLNFKQTFITSDAQTSLYGAGQGCPIIVVALGTGSVAMRLDNNGVEKQFGGWGFSAGDQGGGAYIGRELVASILKDFDKDDFQPDALTTAVLNIIGSEQSAILNWLQQASPAKFATLAPVAIEFMAQNRLAKKINYQDARK